MEILDSSNNNIVYNNNIDIDHNVSELDTFIFPDFNIFLYDILPSNFVKTENDAISNSSKLLHSRNINQNSILETRRNSSVIIIKEVVDDNNIKVVPIPPPPPPPVAQLVNKTLIPFIPHSVKNKFSNGMRQLFRDVPFECHICLDEVIETYSFPSCDHTYCINCVKSHLTAQIWLKKGDSLLSCPTPKCKSTITLFDLESLVDKTVFDKFILYSKIKEKQYGDDKVLFCINCDNPISIESSTKEVTCDSPDCNSEMCVECYTFTHPGIDCQQNKQNIVNCMSIEEKKTLELFKKDQVKECPRCKRYVCKDDGCEYVMCVTCSYQFCYYCLEPHDHNMNNHIHGPLYQPPENIYYAPPVYIRNNHSRRFKKCLKYFGMSLLLIIGIGPLIVVGGGLVVGTILISPFCLLYKHLKYRKKLRKSKSFQNWCLNEKKRREELGLEVSEYIIKNCQI